MSELMYLPTDAIVPSAANPRRTVDAVANLELLESVRQRGILQALLVRELPEKVRLEPGTELVSRFELVDGFRRWSAAKELGFTDVPCMVREAADDEARTDALIANLQRQGLAPLDEAHAFRALLDFATGLCTPATLAARIGKAERHVWDTLKLLDLVPDAQRLLADGILPLPHAQVLAKLAADDQKRALKLRDAGYDRHCAVFEDDGGFDFEDRGTKKAGKWEGLKPVSVAELRKWVQDHVRFNPAHAAKADPLVFTETAKTVETAVAQPGRGKKVVSITFDNFVQPDAKDAEGERTYGERSWRRADGQEKSKPCEASVLGVVVVGPRYGETFDVCVKKGCPVHWPEQKKAPAKAGRTGVPQHAGNNEDIHRREQAQRDRESKAWAIVYPQVCDALIAATAGIQTSDAHLKDALDLRGDRGKAVLNVVGSVTYKTFGRALVLENALQLAGNAGWFNEHGVSQALKTAKARFDVKAAMKAAIAQFEKPAAAAPAAPPKKTPATKPAAKAKAKKGRAA